jgi:hypothetical protein
VSGDDFFVGWRKQMPAPDRRAMLGAAIALVATGAGLGALAGLRPVAPGGGTWDQGNVRSWTGLLLDAPYPALRWRDASGVRTGFLATGGKTRVRPPPSLIGTMVRLDASLIARGRNAMLAVREGSFRPARLSPPPELAWPAPLDRGEVLLAGEILDAKCWFGAMRPGYGKTHKACAALCARGGLPLAFCRIGACGDDGLAPLLLDGAGRAHGRALAALVGEPVAVTGRLVDVGDITQLRADIGAIRRL